MNEIQEALDRAASEVRALNPYHPFKTALLAIVDTLVEIAATLPTPHTVPKEPEDPAA